MVEQVITLVKIPIKEIEEWIRTKHVLPSVLFESRLEDNNLVLYFHEEELEKYEVGEHLKVQGIHETFSGELGHVEIESPGSRSASWTLRDVFPPSALLDGQTVPIPPFSFNQISFNVQGFENFESVLLESGYIQITLRNDLPVPISENLLLQVKRQGTDETILQYQFPQMIQPGSSATQDVDLAGIRIPSDLKFEISIPRVSPFWIVSIK